MDRARRAEPYSNATIWTREIARNLAGHLDRLSKVHSCVDSSSPKTSHIKHTGVPLKRSGQVSPLRLEHSAPVGSRAQKHENEDRSGSSIGLNTDQPTSREEAEKVSTPVKRRQLKALKKIKSVSRRTQGEIDHPDILAHENQRLPDHAFHSDPSLAAEYPEYSDALQHASHFKKVPPQDYHKRQEQQRIWQENQALAKRLRNTKPTLSSKMWEKDDKWNQDFLRKQEKRRQALHHEMARTLASPHSALIRVKHVTHSTFQSSEDQALEDHFGGKAGTAIEVTTRSTIANEVRDLRRRRSVGEDTQVECEPRQHSTAPNHRRIMELRRQRERCPKAAVTDTGPPDELVSVRFTFSREGQRGLCTPNGITGQFSPAVELEAALEASFDEEIRLVSFPDLEPPHSSRLDENESQDVGNEVSDALLACIDVVVASAVENTSHDELAMTEDVVAMVEATDAVENPFRNEVETSIDTAQFPSSDTSAKAILQENGLTSTGLDANQQNVEDKMLQSEDVEDNMLQSQSQDGAEAATATEATVSEEMDEQDGRQESIGSPEEKAHEDELQQDLALGHMSADAPLPVVESSEVNISEPPSTSPLQTEPQQDQDSDLAAVTREPLHLDMETSAYGSEFDAEETARVPPTAPIVQQPPLEDQTEDENEYEDDHAAEDPPPSDTTANPIIDDHDGPHYDDDLEPEALEPEEQSYADDGFD